MEMNSAKPQSIHGYPPSIQGAHTIYNIFFVNRINGQKINNTCTNLVHSILQNIRQLFTVYAMNTNYSTIGYNETPLLYI